MNAWQVIKQLRHLLRQQTWPDGAQELVFSSRVYASVMIPDRVLPKIGFPFALVSPADAEGDEDSADLEIARFTVALVVSSAGDYVGEAALIGGVRGNGQGSSLGRGLMEVEEVLHDAVGKLGKPNGVAVQVVARSAPEATDVSGLGFVVVRVYTLEGRVTKDRSYPPPTRFLATAAGGGGVSLTWSLPPARYDLSSVVLRRADGATAPASVADGVGVTLPDSLATSVTDLPGAGTFSYALFAGYDELAAGVADRYSTAAERTVVAT